MSSRKRSIPWVMFMGLAGITGGLVGVFAIAGFPQILILPILAALLIGITLYYRSTTQRSTTQQSLASTSPTTTPEVQDKSSRFDDLTPQLSRSGNQNLFKDRYRLLELLASGRFGKTYVAEDTTVGSKSLWVIKHFIPQPEHDRDLSTTQRLFKGEALVMEKLQSLTVIPKLLNYFETEQEVWFIREYIVGNPLNEELISGKPIAEKQIAEILKDILTGLEAIHEFNIIHRDIKPSNIIRQKKDNRLILIDFGAAKEWNPQEESKPMMTVAIGTASYAAYEQMIGQPVPSSDIFSAGVIAIQGITGLEPGRLPLTPKGEYDWRRYAQVSPKLADILDKMTKTNVYHRYQNATDVLADLNQL